jgi:hypothetical protein
MQQFRFEALLRELGIYLQQKPCLLCDNVGVISLYANPMFHVRTRHIKIDYHFLRERVISRNVEIADGSTKT